MVLKSPRKEAFNRNECKFKCTLLIKTNVSLSTNLLYLMHANLAFVYFKVKCFFCFVFVGPPKESIFFWPPSMVYISVIITHILQITFLHDVDLLWAVIVLVTLWYKHAHSGYYDSVGTPRSSLSSAAHSSYYDSRV